MSVDHTALPPTNRRRLFARTALCGALCGLSLLPGLAQALPTGAVPEVNAGGVAPTINTSGTRLDVTLGAPRTVLNWSTFDVTPDETVSFNFGARNWIVLNRIGSLTGSKIEGTIEGRVGGEYGGNVWFASQSSIIFGRGSRVDAGSIVAGLGNVDTAGFLDPSNTLFSFSGADAVAGSNIMVLANATLTAHGGMVALMGPSIVTRANALVSATEGSVLYGSAKTFQIRMAPGAGGDFDLVDFIVPDASAGSDAGVAIDLGGGTRANAVFLAAVNRSGIGSAIINLEGMVTAQAAKADGGDIVLSGGGGIANRLPGPALDGVSATDIYLNKGSASRDLRVSNLGRTFGRPWARPLEELKDPPTLEEDAQPCELRSDCGDDGGGNGNGNGFGFAPLDQALDQAVIASLFDPTAVAAVTAGRDARIAATASIELGSIVAARDIAVQGPDIKANNLVAGGALTVNSTQGDVRLATAGTTREGLVTAKTDALIDTISAPQKLTVNAGRDIAIGDGTTNAAGVVVLSAARNVTLNLGSGRIDTVTAGGAVDLRGAVDVGTITAPRVFGQAASIRIGAVTTTGDLYVVATNGDAIVGDATAGDDIYVQATHGTASLTNATLTGAAPDAVGFDFAGNTDAAGNGRVVQVTSIDLDAKLGLGTGGVTGATTVGVLAGRDAAMEVIKATPGSFSVTAARDATVRAPTVTLDSVQAGRDLSVGSTTGDFTITNALTAVRNISVSAAGALKVADVRADSGSVSLVGATVTAGNVSASEDLTLKALSGGVTTASFKTGRDLIVQGSSLSLGSTISAVPRDLSITSLGNFTSTAPLSAGRNLILDVAGKATVGATTAVNAIRIVAGDLDLTGALTAPNAQIESKGGAMRVGGTADGGSGFIFDGADFGQLRVSGVTRFYAGSTTGTARGDLTLQDLSINPTNTPSVSFLVGSGANALVQGMVAPNTSGGIIRIGDASDMSWRPGSILVSGALGAATFAGGAKYTNIRAFSEVRLAARQDILFGSPRFITLIQETPISAIDIAAGLPAGSAPLGNEVGKVFVSTGRLEVSSDGKAVQQNTAPVGSGGTAGLYFTGAFNPALIIDPPRIVELWGAIAGANGQVITGSAAGSGLTFTVVDSNGQPISRPDGAAYRFNACDVGTTNCPVISSPSSGGGSGDMNAGVLTARDLLDDPGAIDTLGSESLARPPVLLSVAEPPVDEIVTDPVVTGTGSEEIWRKRRQTK
ncbi:filamentous hemagglutinin N-terminal domain-containing protein [Phenylobacterium sp.]|uniref:two-partner secretion domain-containing protein n=1 Tax=Phenylobacterium sp. TaxID=1871053 RepID=UPI0025DEE993|nr:filamentous hemagglutinin N-terminal domain-containing protein [Phenylobacterium sp.]